MKYILHRDLIKSLAKMPIKERELVRQFIKQIPELKSIDEIKNLKKLKGFINAYRIRFGDYRLGLLLLDDNTLALADISLVISSIKLW